MRTVYKYPVYAQGLTTVFLPQGAEVLHVALQGNVPTLWALVESSAPLLARNILVADTGAPVEADWRYLGSVHPLEGRLVWHIFEERQP